MSAVRPPVPTSQYRLSQFERMRQSALPCGAAEQGQHQCHVCGRRYRAPLRVTPGLPPLLPGTCSIICSRGVREAWATTTGPGLASVMAAGGDR